LLVESPAGFLYSASFSDGAPCDHPESIKIPAIRFTDGTRRLAASFKDVSRPNTG
jgi:hypothetical protein